jgi:penicillin amidase
MTVFKPIRRRSAGRRRFPRLLSLAGATTFCLVLAFVSSSGFGTLPALGSTLNPATGIWTDAATAGLPAGQTIHVPGITTPTTVGFSSDGVAHIKAGSDADMFRALGYAEAHYRIFQMDLMRRQAGGQLAAIVGPDALKSDRFELGLGLLRDAQRDWASLPANAPSRAALIDYADGVNSAIVQMKADHTLPMYFKLLGYQPAAWTPVDSLLIQMLETQSLSLDDSPLAFGSIYAGLGPKLFNSFFQEEAQYPQHPFDPGPYLKLPLNPLPSGDPADAAPTQTTARVTSTSADPNATSATPDPAAMTAAASDLLGRIAQLPVNAVHTVGNSNQWVVSGSRTASGGAILATDPHLRLALPSVWFEFSAQSPSYNMSGVGIPGIPAVLIGKTPHISWGITNSQHGTTLYYLEKTSPSRPGQYFWNGAWHPMNTVNYTIAVKGQAPDHLKVNLTVHGPVLTLSGQTASVWWGGSLPTDDLDAMLHVARATNFSQFRSALSTWVMPTLDFGYADAKGNIGIVSAGIAPQVKSGKPWLPLSGTGASDVVGTIPPAAMPSTYNPPGGVASTANNIEVSTSYPYYWGRSTAYFDPGFRESTIVAGLAGQNKITLRQTEQLQNSQVDPTARAILPALLKALKGQRLNATQSAAAAQLQGWNGDTSKDSTAASIWSGFLTNYLDDVWNPIAAAYKIKTPPPFPNGTAKDIGASTVLLGLLASDTQSDHANSLFSLPGMAKRTAPEVLRQAFGQTISQIAAQYGPTPSKWLYGEQHSVMIASLLSNSTLDAGPYPIGGDTYTINAMISPVQTRDGKELVGANIGGASWRYIVDWGSGRAETSLPGGTAENAASPWYDNRLNAWLNGKYNPVTGNVGTATKGMIWTFAS